MVTGRVHRIDGIVRRLAPGVSLGFSGEGHVKGSHEEDPLAQDTLADNGVSIFGGRLFVHTRIDPYALVTPVTRIVRAMSVDQPVEHAATLEDIRAQASVPWRDAGNFRPGFIQHGSEAAARRDQARAELRSAYSAMKRDHPELPRFRRDFSPRSASLSLKAGTSTMMTGAVASP
jgi:hypothetical protein